MIPKDKLTFEITVNLEQPAPDLELFRDRLAQLLLDNFNAKSVDVALTSHWGVPGLLQFRDSSAITDRADKMHEAVRRLIEYRDRAGAMNFQLEKADDFINELRAAIARAEGGE